jgi:hypothetical protein
MRDILIPIYPSNIRPIMRRIFDQMTTNSREELTSIIQRMTRYYEDMDSSMDYLEPYIQIKHQLVEDRDQLHKIIRQCSRHKSFWVNDTPPDVHIQDLDLFWNSLTKANIILFRVYHLRTLRVSFQNIQDP